MCNESEPCNVWLAVLVVVASLVVSTVVVSSSMGEVFFVLSSVVSYSP